MKRKITTVLNFLKGEDVTRWPEDNSTIKREKVSLRAAVFYESNQNSNIYIATNEIKLNYYTSLPHPEQV